MVVTVRGSRVKREKPGSLLLLHPTFCSTWVNITVVQRRYCSALSCFLQQKSVSTRSF